MLKTKPWSVSIMGNNEPRLNLQWSKEFCISSEKVVGNQMHRKTLVCRRILVEHLTFSKHIGRETLFQFPKVRETANPGSMKS